MSVHHLCAPNWRPGGGVETPEPGITNGCEPGYCGYWELNLGLLEKQSS